ncbi:MAG: hypothetical protein Q4B32_07140 [Clostridia bacterium]|nr:hypothetical protein [Clostridia bacterium]
MKKIFALVLCLVAVCSFTLASASTAFSYSGNEKVNFIQWSQPAESTGNYWHIVWGKNNLSSTKRAVVRVYAAPGVYASSLFVYDSPSTAYHPYKSGYGQGKSNTYLGGRMDNRDSGELNVKGEFYN